MSNSNEELKDVVKEFFSYLDYTEISDNDREFHPIHIGCMRVMMQDKVSACLNRMKELANGVSLQM